jgi:3-phosphoshikimate 1-carboxyvinyltransferase
MALPEVIEIIPPTGPVQAEITVPGSKSITNRALILAALSGGRTTLEGALWSDDTQVMVEALQKLGAEVRVAMDSREPSNRSITIQGFGGGVPQGGTSERPSQIFVGNAGTAARFLTALVCLGKGVFRLQGVPRMHERPQASLFQALRQLGYRIDAPGDRLPASVHGGGPRPGRCRVNIEESSQFASALMLCAAQGGWDVQVLGENREESPYVRMTVEMIHAFPRSGGTFAIEADASSASYFCAANALLGLYGPLRLAVLDDEKAGARTFRPESAVSIMNRPGSDWQIDAAFPRFLAPRSQVSRRNDLGDSILTLMVLAPFAERAVRFTDLGRLRLQECERVAAMRMELSKCGAEVLENGDELTVLPSSDRMHGAEIETYQDHRVAMCFATLGLKVPGISLKNPRCVKKTFPNFFQKLAAAPPSGLGAGIQDLATGRPLEADELLAT